MRRPAPGIHYSAQQTAYIGPGDLTGAAEMSEPATITSWVFLTAWMRWRRRARQHWWPSGTRLLMRAVDRRCNHRWPDILAERLRARRGGRPIGVLDAGIGGNRVLFDRGNVRFGVNALARFDRDVLAQPGVKYVIVLKGINHLGHPGSSAPLSETVSAEDLIAGLKQMIERAHEHGLKIFGATLTPFEGTTIQGYFSPEKEAKRKAVNEWIRTGNAFDGVIDFDKAARDPQHPDRMLPVNDGGLICIPATPATRRWRKQSIWRYLNKDDYRNRRNAFGGVREARPHGFTTGRRIASARSHIGLGGSGRRCRAAGRGA